MVINTNRPTMIDTSNIMYSHLSGFQTTKNSVSKADSSTAPARIDQTNIRYKEVSGSKQKVQSSRVPSN